MGGKRVREGKHVSYFLALTFFMCNFMLRCEIASMLCYVRVHIYIVGGYIYIFTIIS
jgi:hypothetical protein